MKRQKDITMRISLELLLILGLAGAFVDAGPVREPRGHQELVDALMTRALHDDFEDFVALVPTEEIIEILFEYLESDAEVQFVVDYLQSSEFRELVRVVERMPDVIRFYDYLSESGLDVYSAVNLLHELVGLPPLKPSGRVLPGITGGVAGLIADVKALLPLEDIKALYHEKLETSPEFKKLVERLQSPKFQAVVDALIANEEFQTILQEAKKFGIDVKAVTDLLTTMFGLEFPHHNMKKSFRALHDDLEDFVALVPTDKVMEIVFEYMRVDKEVQFVVDYVQSAEFRELVRVVEQIPDVIKFYDYVAESGLDIYAAVNLLHEYIGLPPLKPSGRILPQITGGVAGLIADVKALLPLEDIKALYHEKLVTSPEFKQLVERLQSPKFQAVVDALIANEEFQTILQEAKKFGIDVKAVTDLLTTMFGLEFPHHNMKKLIRALHDDLEDFVALVPTDKVMEIVFEYMRVDKEVQFVVDYVQSAEFRELVRVVEQIPDVIKFYDYVAESGLDIYAAVNLLHEFIGLPPLKPSGRTLPRITGGVAGLIADVKALLPLEDIKALYHEKLETSPEFKKLVERLQSPKFQAVVDALVSNQEFQKILQEAKKFGIDVKAVTDLLTTMFGLEFPHHNFKKSFRALHDDLEDFVALVPTDKVMEIVFEYMRSDKEVQFVVDYVQSAEFRELVRVVEQIPDVIHFYDYVAESGLDIYAAVNLLHEFIGLPPLKPSGRVLPRITGGVAGLVADVKALLPLEDIKALYHEKLVTSPEFKQLVERLQSPKFQAVVDALISNVEFQNILQEAKKFGIDVKAVTDLLSTMFGLEFPHHNFKKSFRALHDDLEDFVALVPTDAVMEIVFEYMRSDKEVQFVVDYVQSAEFRELVRVVEQIPDVIHFYDYVAESGLDIYAAVNLLHEFIGLPPLKPSGRSLPRITGGVAGLIADVKALLPLEDIKALYHEKLETSPEFKKLVERLQSPKFQAVVDALIANEEFQTILQEAKKFGIDVKAVTDLLTTMFGLEFPHHNFKKSFRALHDDLEDFVALVPTDKVMEIVFEYMRSDKEVQFVVDYVQSAEFRELVRVVEQIPDVIKFYDYVAESGLDIYAAVNLLHEFIGLPPLKPSGRVLPGITGGVAGLIADVKALLPLEDIKALYHEKLETSPEFKQLVQRLQSPKFQAVVDALVSNQEFQNILQEAKKFGIDVKAVTDLLTTMFGLEFPHHNFKKSFRALHDDLEDFVALVPTDAVMEIVFEYMRVDKEVQFVVDYVQSTEFRELVRVVEQIPDVIKFYDYVAESGLDIYAAVNLLHEFIGLPPLKPSGRTLPRITGGVAGLIADVKALLPLEDIKALYHEKLETSPEFKKLVERLQSPKFQAVVDTLIANEEFQTILHHAKQFGVDVKAVTNLLATIFGLEFPEHKLTRSARSLRSDLEDFMELVPRSTVLSIFFQYMAKDEETQHAIEYMQTSEFRDLVRFVEAMPDVINFYNYLEESGLDIYSSVNRLHDIIGLPHLFPERLAVSITGGVAGLIADIKKLLPLEDIEALYHKKMATSVEFKNFIARLQSPKFQNIIDRLMANEEFQNILNRAKLAGVDVKAFADLFTEMFNIHWHSSKIDAIKHYQGITMKSGMVPHSKAAVRTYIHGMFTSYSLREDIDDFIFLLPLDEIAIISVQYFMNDPEVFDAVKYIKSQEFRELVIRLQGDPEVDEFLRYLEESGLDIIGFFNSINEMLGLPPYPARPYAILGRGGVQGMLQDIQAVMPYDKIKLMYEEKMETSPEFRHLVQRLKAPELQQLVDKMVVNKNMLELGHQAQEHGISIEHIVQVFGDLLGLQFPSPSWFLGRQARTELQSDLDDFIGLLPLDDLSKVALMYFAADEEVQAVVAYLRSAKFQSLVSALHDIPEYNYILDELEAAGLDVRTWIYLIHSLIESDRQARVTALEHPGVAGFIQEVKALLPYSEIKALYHEKLEHSQAFKEFVALISSAKFQTLTNVLFANKDFQDLLHEAQAHGVDLHVISDLFFNIFGITTPPGIINSLRLS